MGRHPHTRRVKPVGFDAFRDSLQPIGAAAVVDAATRASVQAVADALTALKTVSRRSLAPLIRNHPDWVPHLASVCRLSQEKLKSALKHGLGTEAWKTLARNEPERLIELLDKRFGLVTEGRGKRARPG